MPQSACMSSEKVQQMPKLEWSDSFSVGIDRFDAQHKVILQYLNELYDALSGKGDQKEAVGKIVDGLIGYTLSHFQEEEVEMFRHEYPEYDAHKDMHDKLVAAAREFKTRFVVGRTSPRKLAIEIIAVLQEWLKGHILGVDRKYGAYLNQRGVN